MVNKKPVTYAFIDSQNLNLGIQSLGWKLDFKKFRLYLKNKYSVDKAIIVSGDGDFMCLVEYLHEKGKMAHVLVSNAKYSKLLGNFQQYIFRLDRLKNTLEYKKDQRRRSVETLGVSGHGDTSSIAKRARKVNKRSSKNGEN